MYIHIMLQHKIEIFFIFMKKAPTKLRRPSFTNYTNYFLNSIETELMQ
jgi:hypothetical protein